MDAIRTDNYGGVSELLDSMDTSINMLEAFAAMLGYTLISGDGVGNISWGAESLVRQQCQDLQFIRKAMREQFDALRDDKIHVKDIHDVARIVALSPDKAAQVLSFAVGINKYGEVHPDRNAVHG